MIVVSDTSPISALLRIKQLDLLEKLYEKVIIPEAVERELLRGHCTLPSFVEIRAIKDTAAFKRLCSRLDPGEAEAIVLARELHADFILIDESLRRSVAVDEGVRVVGLLGVLVVAKARKLVVSLAPIIEQLETEAHFRISKELKQRVLIEANEP